MFIQTESTPNPNALKFILGVKVSHDSSKTFSYKKSQECTDSNLAKKFFNLDGVEEVFFSQDFVTITKSDDKQWSVIRPHILSIILDHLTAGEEIIKTEMGRDANLASDQEDSEIVKQIKALIEERVRPAVAADGGDIEFYSFDEESGVLELMMKGSCSGCPSSSVTLKNGIENMLKHYIPEVQEVRAV